MLFIQCLQFIIVVVRINIVLISILLLASRHIIAVVHIEDLMFTSLLLDKVHYQELRTIHVSFPTRLCQAEMIFQIVKSDSELPV